MIEPLENIPLAELTTLKLGGKARYFVECTDVEEVKEAVRFARSRGISHHILGGGSNTIFRDEGFDGMVIKIAMQGVQFVGERIVVASGEPWDGFVKSCISLELGGVECLSGIPGLVGATPMQNVGAYGQEVSETITGVEALNLSTLEMDKFSASDCGFSYRRSRFNGEDAGRFVITQVTFALRKVEPEIRYAELRKYIDANVDLAGMKSIKSKLETVRNAVLSLRRSKSMVIDEADPNTCSAGSFFKNPVLSAEMFGDLKQRCKANGINAIVPSFPAGEHFKVPAAWLLENAGFHKGYRSGGVGVSTNHTLALVNFGGTTKGLLDLAETIRTVVHQKFGVTLEREPVLV